MVEMAHYKLIGHVRYRHRGGYSYQRAGWRCDSFYFHKLSWNLRPLLRRSSLKL